MKAFQFLFQSPYFFASLVAIIFATSPVSSIAHQPSGYSDHYAFAGDVCKIRNPNITSYRRINGSFKNVGQGVFKVTCPVFTKVFRPEQLPGDSDDRPVNIGVAIIFDNSNSTPQNFSCIFGRGNETVTVEEEISEAGQIFGGFERVFSNEVLANPLHLECRLPAQTDIRSISVLIDEIIALE